MRRQRKSPWLYLYWTNDKSKYQQFSFESYGTEAKFEEFCLMLAPKDNTVKYKLKFSDSIFESERTLYAPGCLFSKKNGVWYAEIL